MSGTLFSPHPLPEPGGVSIIEGHASDLMLSCPPLDLLASDPPYALGGEGAEHAISATVATVLRLAAERLKAGRWAVIYSAASWRSTAYMIEATRNVLEPVRFGTWAKPVCRTKVRTAGWSWASVNVILFRKPGGDKSGDPSDALDYIVEPPYMVGRRAQLPDRVAEWSIAPFVVGGGVMLDPFAGAGTLCRAASRLGMAAIGYEHYPSVTLRRAGLVQEVSG